jgi:hypothetical protein
MPTYAASTSVTAQKSRLEIERTLERFGATQFAYATGEGQAMIGFAAHGRQVRFTLMLPAVDDPLYTRSPTGRPRTAATAKEAHEQGIRQAWRALTLLVLAKLEAVESGIVEFEREFLSQIVLPNGDDVFDEVRAAVETSYATGEVRPFMAIGR